MVYYYCEFCNKNIQVSEGLINCKSCGHLLYQNTITPQERKRRDRERITYCEYCDKMEYAVPIQVVVSNIEQQGQTALHSIKYPSKPVLQVKDGRYKSGYRLTKEGEEQEMLYCILCILTIVTLGLALIPIGIYYHLQSKKEKENIQSKFNITAGSLDTILQTLNGISGSFSYVCRRCYNGVKLGEKESLTIKKFRLAFDQRCFSFEESRVQQGIAGLASFYKKHIVLIVFGMLFIIDMIIGVSIAMYDTTITLGESVIYDATITIAAILILLFVPILITDIFVAKKIKAQKTDINKTQKIDELKKQEDDHRLVLEKIANDANSISDNAFMEYNSGHLENAVNVWENALSILINGQNTINGINSYAITQIDKMINRLKINIRNANKSISTNIRSSQVIDTPAKIYCDMCGKESNTDQKFCINCGTQLRTSLLNLKLNEDDKLMEQCESPIEE